MADPVSRAYARSLLRLRVARGWTQESLAAHASVSVDTVRRIEQNARNSRLWTAHALAAALGTTVDAMIGEDDLKAVSRG